MVPTRISAPSAGGCAELRLEPWHWDATQALTRSTSTSARVPPPHHLNPFLDFYFLIYFLIFFLSFFLKMKFNIEMETHGGAGAGGVYFFSFPKYHVNLKKALFITRYIHKGYRLQMQKIKW